MHRSRRPARPARNVRTALVSLSLLAAAVGVVGSVVGAPSAGAATKKPNVTIKTFRFRPATLEVPAGTKVTWKNTDAIEHTVTSEAGAPAKLDGVLSGAGKKYAVTLTEPGTYEYFCSRHNSMRGTVIVDAAASSTSSASSSSGSVPAAK
jgi:plastocyanin